MYDWTDWHLLYCNKVHEGQYTATIIHCGNFTHPPSTFNQICGDWNLICWIIPIKKLCVVWIQSMFSKFHTYANKWWEHFSYIINIFTSSILKAWNLCYPRFVKRYILFILIWMTIMRANKEDFSKMAVIHKNVDNFKLLLCVNHILGHLLLCIHFRQFIVNPSTIIIMHLSFILPLWNPTNPIHNSSCRLRLPYIQLK